jgi:pimeloyl-ACP methyl ester carboxylesterase
MSTFSQLKAIHVNGVDLHYIEQGRGDGVVLVHGGGATDFRTWGRQIDLLAQHYRVVAYSLRYHYPNAWVGDGSDYSTAVHAHDLATLIQALQLASAHIVTSSYGGDIALLMTREQPQLVRTLVLGEPPLAAWRMRLVAETARPGEVSAQSWDASAKAVQRGDFECGVRLFASRVMGEGAYDRLPETVRRRMLDNARVLTLPEAVFLSDLSCDDAGDMAVPALILTGEASPQQFQIVADELARCMPNVQRATIPQTSHLLHGMSPTIYNETVSPSWPGIEQCGSVREEVRSKTMASIQRA